MKHRSITMGLLLLASVPLASRAADDPKDVKEIRESVKAFVQALAKGDSVEARRHATSDETTNTVLEAVIPLIKASNQLDAASVKAFGQQGAVFGRQANPLAALGRFAQTADTGQVLIKGYDAVLMPTPPQTQPADGSDPALDPNPPTSNDVLFLRYEASAWRVNLSAMRNARQMVRSAPMMKYATEGMNQTSDQIRAGLYETLQDARRGLRQNISAAMARAQGQ